MCIFIDHDVQLVIDLSAMQVRTRLLLMTMIEIVLLITSNLYITIPPLSPSQRTLEVKTLLIKRWHGTSSFDPTFAQGRV